MTYEKVEGNNEARITFHVGEDNVVSVTIEEECEFFKEVHGIDEVIASVALDEEGLDRLFEIVSKAREAVKQNKEVK